MKKLLYIFSIFIVALAFFVGCACSEENETERLLRLYDLNSDGVIDFWEQPFENIANSNREIGEDFAVNDIDSVEDFIAISDKENSPQIVYRLTKNLDFSNIPLEEPVDFGGAILYGNNKSIYKFTLDSFANNFEYALIKDASKVFDTNFYLGMQYSQPNYASMSVLSNVAEIDNIKVRGCFNIVHTNSLNLSFLLIGSTVSKISNVAIEGVLNTNTINAVPNSSSIFNFGGVASTLTKGSEITNATTIIAGEVSNYIWNFIGSIAGVSNGFIEDCNSKLDLIFTVDDRAKSRIGGTVGQLQGQGEIKHCVSDIDIIATRSEEFGGNDCTIAVGGLVAESFGSLFYNESKGNIKIVEVAEVSVGGMIGSSFNTYALRNISKVNILIAYENEQPFLAPLKPKIYVASFVGSAIKGVFESCIAVGDIELKLAYSEFQQISREVNVGLFFFHSSYFKDIYNIQGMSKEQAKQNDTLIGQTMLYPNYSPSLIKNIVQGGTVINSSADNINYGGYWWWILTGNNTSNPEIFEGSSSYGATFTLNQQDRTNEFLPPRLWLERKVLPVSDLGVKFGILSSESNYLSISSLKDLEFINNADLKGSYYKSNAVINSKSPNIYDFHATSINELEYLATYLLEFKNTITFEVNNTNIIAESGFISRITDIKEDTLVFASKTIEGGEIEYFIFTKAEWAKLNQVEYDRIASENLADVYGITSDIQYIIIEEIMNAAKGVNISYRRIKNDTADDRSNIYFTYKKPGTTSNQIMKLDISYTIENNQEEYARYTMYFVGEA